jgi:hypothetical protein
MTAFEFRLRSEPIQVQSHKRNFMRKTELFGICTFECRQLSLVTLMNEKHEHFIVLYYVHLAGK